MRREYPEPLIALLVFILGVWVWDHYLGNSEGYAPGTEQIALLKIERDLQISEAMGSKAPWIGDLAGIPDPQVVRRRAISALSDLASEKSITSTGNVAFEIVNSLQNGTAMPSRESLLTSRLGDWWHFKWMQATSPALDESKGEIFNAHGQKLVGRVLASRLAVGILAMLGLLCVPWAIKELKSIRARRDENYGDRWGISLGLTVFLVVILASLGFGMTLDLGISLLPGLPPGMGIALGATASMLPALMALGLLFRRPGHATRVLGINRPVHLMPVLSLFTLLLIFDQLFDLLTGNIRASEPGGGLSLGDAGGLGLVSIIVLSCIVAPISEEILYRGVLFRSLSNRLGFLYAATASSVVFAILHLYNGYGLLSVGLFGFCCATLYHFTRSLSAVILLHVLYNSTIKIPEWFIYHAPLS